MCSVASEEDPTAAEALGNQRVTRRPRVPREDLRVDLGAVTSVVSSRLTSATRACTPSCASAHATNRQP